MQVVVKRRRRVAHASHRKLVLVQGQMLRLLWLLVVTLQTMLLRIVLIRMVLVVVIVRGVTYILIITVATVSMQLLLGTGGVGDLQIL